MQRLAVVFLVCAGCAEHGTRGDACTLDSDCGDYVCARDGTCEPSSDVRDVKIMWTIHGGPATVVSCTKPDLYIQYDGPELSDFLGIEPVPCRQGQFNIDKLPFRYGRVEIGPTDGPPTDISRIDMVDDHTGVASLDLFL
jgi:hypothetical protein